MARFVLVLQWAASSIDDYDVLVEVENSLLKALPITCDVDGHDFGAGEGNIFILTTEPMSAFEAVRHVLEKWGLLGTVRAAYRREENDDFTILWPESLTEFDVA